MATSTKRRVTRVGAKHRLYITIEQDTFKALQGSGEREGYSISALASRVIIRGVACGLIDDPDPTLNEQYYLLTEKLHRSLKEQIGILEDALNLKNQQIAQLDAGLQRNMVEAVRLAIYNKDYKDRLEAAGLTVPVEQPEGPVPVQTEAPKD